MDLHRRSEHGDIDLVAGDGSNRLSQRTGVLGQGPLIDMHWEHFGAAFLQAGVELVAGNPVLLHGNTPALERNLADVLIEDLQNLRREIDLYDPRLSQRPWHIIANKMDLPGAEENLGALQKRFPNVETVAISAAQSAGLDELKDHLERWLFDENAEEDSEVKTPEIAACE